MPFVRTALVAAFVLLAAPAAAADDLPVDRVALIQAEQAKAQKAVEKKYGNKPSSELTTDERRQMIQDSQAADREVFDKHGVSPKDFAIREARMNRADRQALQDAKAALAAKEEAAKAEADKQANAPPAEVEIIRGTTDETPLEVFRDSEAVDVERPNEDGLIEPGENNAEAIDGQSSQPLEIDTTTTP